MTDTHDTPGRKRARAGRRYRRRSSTSREYRLTPRFNDEELARIEAAAEAAAMTLTGYCAMAVVAAAGGEHSEMLAGLPSEDELGEMQRELYAARVAVNKAGTNLNQAVAQLNATGEPPVWLDHAVERSMRAVEQVDAVVSRIHQRLTDAD
jgi:hypothetical protein